jgi:medium-chain acyl-[acyl-carrier-protein] hydrolase
LLRSGKAATEESINKSNIFYQDQKIYTYDCLQNYCASPVSVLNYFQEIALEHSAALKAGPYELDRMHLAWIVVKYHIEIIDYPKFLQTVRVGTWAGAAQGFIANRGFVLEDEDGKTMVKGQSHWMMMDFDKDHIVRVGDNEINNVYQFKEDGDKYRIPRLKRVADWDSHRQFAVRYLDIDYNGHVNNVRYLAWAFEAIPADLISKVEVADFDILYKEQAKFGDVVTVCYKKTDDTHCRMDIQNQDGLLLCQIGMTLRPASQKPNHE